jgi:hypothetical protein
MSTICLEKTCPRKNFSRTNSSKNLVPTVEKAEKKKFPLEKAAEKEVFEEI